MKGLRVIKPFTAGKIKLHGVKPPPTEPRPPAPPNRYGKNSERYLITLTKEEVDSTLIQINGRIQELKEMQIQAGKDENIARVLELENAMKSIISAKDKMMKVRYDL